MRAQDLALDSGPTAAAAQRSGRFSLGPSVVAAAHFANDALTSMIPALLPLLALRFDLAPTQIALLASVFAVSTSLPQPFFGSLADRWGSHFVGAIGLGVSAALLFGLSTTPSALWLGILFALGGLGSAALHPAGMTLSRAAAKLNPGLALAVFTAAGMAGGAVGPLLALGITAVYGLQQLAWVTAVPTMIVAALLFRFAPRAPTSAASGGAPPAAGLRLLLGPVAPLAFVALCANFAVLAFMSAVPLWLLREHGLGENSPVLGLTLSIFSVAAALGGMLGGTLTRWLSASRLIAGSLVGALLALETLFVTVPGSAAYYATVALAGLLLFVQSSLVIVRAQELSPGAESAVSGLLLGGTTAAAGLVYALLGPAQAAFGTAPTLVVAFLVLLPAAHIATTALAEPKATRLLEAPACCDCPA